MLLNNINIPATSAPYPKNQWYVVAFSRDVTRELKPTQILGLPILLYRDAGGKPVALLDRCPHRGMPLSKGKLVGERVQCVYHGIEFDSQGRCGHIPTGGPTPAGLCVESFAVVERWQWIWMWAGKADEADPSLIPDHDELRLTAPGYSGQAGVIIDIDCNHLVALENLSDLTHLPFLHGAPPAFGDPTVQATGNRVAIARPLIGDQYPEFMVELLGIRLGRVQGGVTQYAYMPGIVVVAAAFDDLDQDHRPHIDNRWVVGFTPVGPGKTRAFFSLAINYDAKLVGFWEMISSTMVGDYEPMAELQRLDDSVPAEFKRDISVKADAGLVHMRRIMGEMIAAAEAARVPVPRVTQALRGAV